MEPIGHNPQSVEELSHAVRSREELLATFLRYVPAPVAMFDREMRYLQASDRWCADYGLDSAYILGRSHYEIFPDIPQRWKEIHRRCLAGEAVRAEDDVFERADGGHIHLRWEVRPWGNRDGLPEGILIFSEDITQRKKLEYALQDERDRLEKILATTPGAICAFRLRPDGSTSLPYASRAFQRMLPELPDLRQDASPLFAMMHPEDAIRVRASIAESARTMTPWRDNFRMLTPSRGTMWFEGHSLPEREPDGSVYWYGLLTDISERTRMEDALRERDAIITSVFDSASQGIVGVYADGTIQLLNRMAEKIFGYEKEELLGRPLEILVQEGARGRHAEYCRAYFAKPQDRPMGVGFDLEGLRKDGSTFPIEIGLSSIEAAQGRLGVAFVTDITARKRGEEALRNSEERLRLAIESTGLGTFDYDPRTGAMAWSDSTKRHFGLPPDAELDVETFYEALHRDDRERLRQLLQSVLQPESGGHYATEYRTIGIQDRKERWISAWGQVFFDGEGHPKRFIGVTQDVTQRKRTEEALRQREQEVSTLLDDTPDVILRLDRQFRFTYVNAKTASIAGIPREAFIGKTSLELGLPQDLIDIWMVATRRAFETGQPATLEFSYPSPGGATEWEERFIPECAADGSVESVLVIGRDVTERKRLERIAETNRQEIRALSASLLTAQEEERRRVSRELHDQICQQLASLAFDIGGLVADPPAPAEARNRLKALQARVAKASDETRHIAYKLHPSILDDLGVVASLRSLCKEFSERAPDVELAFNSDALPGTSVSREVTSCVYRVAQESLQNIAKHANAKHVSMTFRLQGRAIELTIADDGIGFDPEAIRGRGGLGLIGMEERARLVNGKLSIASKPGHGTRLALEVPLDDASL